MTDATVEDLNPRGQVVKTMEMAIRRSRVLRALCRQALDASYGDHRTARRMVPWHEGYGARRQDVMLVFGDPPYEGERIYADWWPWFYDQWTSGALDRGEAVALSLLPSTVRRKLDE